MGRPACSKRLAALHSQFRLAGFATIAREDSNSSIGSATQLVGRGTADAAIYPMVDPASDPNSASTRTVCFRSMFLIDSDLRTGQVDSQKRSSWQAWTTSRAAVRSRARGDLAAASPRSDSEDLRRQVKLVAEARNRRGLAGWWTAA